MSPSSPFDFTLELSSGKTFSLADCQGRPLLVVNTATQCGLAPQFEGLEALHRELGPRGLTLIGIPCNQFGDQEPEPDLTMGQTCKINFGVTFPLTKKASVNGPETHPLVALLKSRAPGLLGFNDIKWNFTKFLVWPDGSKVKRYAPTTEPEEIRKDIEALLP